MRWISVEASINLFQAFIIALVQPQPWAIFDRLSCYLAAVDISWPPNWALSLSQYLLGHTDEGILQSSS